MFIQHGTCEDCGGPMFNWAFIQYGVPQDPFCINCMAKKYQAMQNQINALDTLTRLAVQQVEEITKAAEILSVNLDCVASFQKNLDEEARLLIQDARNILSYAKKFPEAARKRRLQIYEDQSS